jgi:hypothetical protein
VPPEPGRCSVQPPTDIIRRDKEVKPMKEEQKVQEGYVVAWTTYITLKNGKRIYAASYGLKAFPLKIRR